MGEHLKAVSSASTQALETPKWLTLIDEKVEAERRAANQRTRLLAWAASGGFAAVALMLGILLWRLAAPVYWTVAAASFERALSLLEVSIAVMTKKYMPGTRLSTTYVATPGLETLRTFGYWPVALP